MGCSASDLAAGDDYPGAGREERDTIAARKEAAEAMSNTEEADETRHVSATQQKPVTVAKAASPQVTRKAREKEWGPDITAAYYEFMYAQEEDLEDDWQRRAEQHGPADHDPLGAELQPASPSGPEIGGPAGGHTREHADGMRVFGASNAALTSQQEQRLAEFRQESEQKEAANKLREQIRQSVIQEIKSRMMGLHDDPRIVLQVLNIPCEGGSNPSHQELFRALRKALIRYHPDRQLPKSSTDDPKQEVETEETFKMLVRLRDRIKDQMEQESKLAQHQ